MPSGNPLGKNPSDIWEVVSTDWDTGLWNVPNVKAAHPEKTSHPAQFPIEGLSSVVFLLSRTRTSGYLTHSSAPGPA